ncbi:hypothetical protein [Vibrio phage vB_VpaP_SJSY21]|nr:hypothetical protein [Vibrio phage vB_VpaP_SJSY21]
MRYILKELIGSYIAFNGSTYIMEDATIMESELLFETLSNGNSDISSKMFTMLPVGSNHYKSELKLWT